MRLSVPVAATALLLAAGVHAQSAAPQTSGPKVHTTEVEDTTDCMRNKSGRGGSIGALAGSIVGNRIVPGYGGLAGQTAGQVADAAAENADKREKCRPDAYVEGQEDSAPAPKKKKGLGGLRSSLGL